MVQGCISDFHEALYVRLQSRQRKRIRDLALLRLLLLLLLVPPPLLLLLLLLLEELLRLLALEAEWSDSLLLSESDMVPGNDGQWSLVSGQSASGCTPAPSCGLLTTMALSLLGLAIVRREDPATAGQHETGKTSSMGRAGREPTISSTVLAP